MERQVNDTKKINDEDHLMIDELNKAKAGLEKNLKRAEGTNKDQADDIARIEKEISLIEKDLADKNIELDRMLK